MKKKRKKRFSLPPKPYSAEWYRMMSYKISSTMQDVYDLQVEAAQAVNLKGDLMFHIFKRANKWLMAVALLPLTFLFSFSSQNQNQCQK